VAGAAITAYGASEDSKDQSKAAKLNSELGFQREAWLDQQARKYALEDRRYVEDSIGGFRGFAPESARSFNGQPVQAPALTTTTGLADWNPNVRGAFNRPLVEEFGANNGY
jgi:hypothetical protein